VLVLSDIGVLFDIDLRSHPLVAVDSITPGISTVYGLLNTSARSLRTGLASELRRSVHLRHPKNFTGFNAGVLVIDLALLRVRKAAPEILAVVDRYGLNDNEALVYWAGADRAALPFEWNLVPHQRFRGRPKIVHWAGGLKPWDDAYVLHKELWETYQAKYQERMTKIPVKRVTVPR
jgi:lipopolysaccharide biosynthesis glycosyltransferase